MLHAHNTIENKTELIDQTMNQVEKFVEQITKSSITKVLIYHVNSSMLSSQQMIINQIRKPKDDSPVLLDYLLSTKDQTEVAILECASVS